MSTARLSERELRGLIVKTCQALSRKNLVAATDGNVSARLGAERVLITPSGVGKGEIATGDILICDLEGRKIKGAGDVSSEVQVHLAAYRSRATIGGVVHAHPPLATAFTYVGLEYLFSERIIPEVTAQIGPIPAVPYRTPGSRELAEAAGPLFATADIVLLVRHGAVSVGDDPWGAYLRMEKLEHTALILKTGLEVKGGRDRIIRLSEGEMGELMGSYGKKV